MSCQQYELYAAEECFEHDRPVEDLQGFVDAMREHDWWDRNFPNVLGIEAHVDGRRASSVGFFDDAARGGLIDMAPKHVTELFTCHEVAHVLASARYGSKSHDPYFARTYLELVCTVMGSAAYVELRAAFDQARIDYEHESYVPGGIQV